MLEEKELLYEVDGKKVTKEEFEKLQQDPNLRIKPLKEGVFKTLKKMFG